MLGQHHHTECEHDVLHPGCCDDPSVKRRFYWKPNAGTRCQTCGETWRGDPDGWVEGLADRMTAPGRFLNGPVRGVIFRHHKRILNEQRP